MNKTHQKNENSTLILLVGIPGSGKSFITKHIKQLGIRHISSDKFFETFLKENKLPLDFNQMDEEMLKKAVELRDKASKKNDILLENSFKTDINLAIESSGSSNSIAWLNNEAKKYNYTTHVIFVCTSLNVAKLRNRSRERKLTDKSIDEVHKMIECQLRNIHKILPSNKVHFIENEKEINTKDELKFFQKSIFEVMSKILDK